jgi:hypothetical protein
MLTSSIRNFDEETVSKIISGLEERLKEALDGDFLPKVSFATISLESRDASSHVSSWAHARTLLTAIARYPREAITDSYFFRGYRVPLADMLAAMNVAEDCLATNWPDSAARTVADSQLAAIKKIEADSRLNDRDQCEQLLALMQSSLADWKAEQEKISAGKDGSGIALNSSAQSL